MNPATLTTGQVAKLAGLSPREICRLIDQGHLKGWRVPGSAHRRVLRTDLVSFLAAHQIPIEAHTPTTLA